MIVQFKATLKDIEHGEARINVASKLEGVYKPLLGPLFVAILRGMKNTDKHAFMRQWQISRKRILTTQENF